MRHRGLVRKWSTSGVPRQVPEEVTVDTQRPLKQAGNPSGQWRWRHQNPCLYPVRSRWVSHDGYQLLREELLLATPVSHPPLLFSQGSETQCPCRFRGLTQITGQFLHKPNRPTGIRACPFLSGKEGKRNHF